MRMIRMLPPVLAAGIAVAITVVAALGCASVAPGVYAGGTSEVFGAGAGLEIGRAPKRVPPPPPVGVASTEPVPCDAEELRSP